MTAGPLAGIVVGLLFLLGVRLFVFRAGAALADTADPGMGKSFVLAAISLVFTAAVVALLWAPAGKMDADPSGLGPMRGLAVALGVLAAAAAAGLLYKLALPTTARKGLLVACYELALGLLLAALVLAAVLVMGAAVQLVRHAETASPPGAPTALFRPGHGPLPL